MIEELSFLSSSFFVWYLLSKDEFALNIPLSHCLQCRKWATILGYPGTLKSTGSLTLSVNSGPMKKGNFTWDLTTRLFFPRLKSLILSFTLIVETCNAFCLIKWQNKLTEAIRKCFDPDYWNGNYTQLSQQFISQHLSPLDLTTTIYSGPPDVACHYQQASMYMARGYNILIH